MSRRRKQDFWDDMEDDVIAEQEADGGYDAAAYGYMEYDAHEGFKLTKSRPVKAIARILLCIAAFAVLLFGSVIWQYVQDRYVDGALTTSYFESNGFSSEYNETIEKLLETLQAVEAEGDITQERAEEIAAGIMGTSSNFSYYIVNESGSVVFTSGDDAKDRIESSNHFLKISYVDGTFTVESGVPTSQLEKNDWQTALDACTNAYQIYTAVDNNLEQEDNFYESYLEYQSQSSNFGISCIAGIAALVVFILLLIFCCIATGRNRGYAQIRLSWFDRIFTELAVIILFVLLLILGMAYVWLADGTGTQLEYAQYLTAGDVFLIYVVLIRGYFSIVRRIKTGVFITNSVIYKICHAINMQLNKLPKVLKVLIITVFLVALNGFLIYGLLFVREPAVAGVPVLFIAAPVIFVIELIAVICCIFGIGDEEYDEYEEDYEANEEPVQEEKPYRETGDYEDWEHIDLGKEVQRVQELGADEDHGTAQSQATLPNVRSRTMDRTAVLSSDERNQVLDRLGFGAETQSPDAQSVQEAAESTRDTSAALTGEQGAEGRTSAETTEAAKEGQADALAEPADALGSAAAVVPTDRAEETAQPDKVDFIQLNRDIRRKYREQLKERGIGVTLRAPQTPVCPDIDEESATEILSLLFAHAASSSQEGSRVYIEMYARDGRMIYMIKNTPDDERAEETADALDDGLAQVKAIVTAHRGRFVTSQEDGIFKAGILLPTAPEER